MKSTSLLLACALGLAGASALAQTGDATTSPPQGAAQRSASGESVIDKAKRGMHRLGDKTRHALHRGDAKDKKEQQARGHEDNTRAMGAGRADEQHSTREQRMDDAYGRWQSQHTQSR